MGRLARGFRVAACVGIVGTSGSAEAADLPVKTVPASPSVYNWTGIYVGGHAGYGMGMKDWPSLNPLLDYDVNGFLGGGQMGVNQQIGNFVIGIELDASWSDVKGSQATFTASPSSVTTGLATTRVDGLVSVTGRFGFAQDRWLVYVKAGAIWIHENHSFNRSSTLAFPGFAPLTDSAAVAGSETRLGPVLGFGAEYALWGNWSLKSEYNYLYVPNGSVRLTGTQTLSGTPAPFAIDANIQQAFHLVKLGVNYRFGPDAPPTIAPARPAPGYNWTGFYVGAQAAYDFGRKAWEVGPEGSFNVRGALAGGVTGTNVQAGAFVFGAESEWMWSGVKGSTRFARPFLTTGLQTFDVATTMDWLSLSSVRAGFVAADRWLVYAKGGVALAREDHALGLLATVPGLGSVTNTATGTALHTGYLAGVGIEYAFLGSWSAKLEYNYIDFLPQNVLGVGPRVTTVGALVTTSADAQRNTIDQNMHLVKFGVNYRFSALPDLVTTRY
jgi:opacity protein-like surface antigen